MDDRIDDRAHTSEASALTITEQIEAIERDLAAERVIDLSNATSAAPLQYSGPWRHGEHRTEAEAALSIAEEALDEVGGEKTAVPLLLVTIAHALLDLAEAVRND
jgi:hypothetical protein